ncbi:pbp domain [Desulfoluna butyratoxydans]|uniref:Pbp domain n=2 Tax=Desulfoluna butyratoxydans TaxID=231438 RepID=A0A4U8YHR2_9BACT|nr:pbp domain [Desulfoluna butyratoxydans]
MMKRRFMTTMMALVAAIAVAGSVQAKALMMATTTSTDNTGLLDYLAPEFTKDTGIELKWTSVGTGKALKLGMNCDVDVLLVHAPPAEKKYIKDGYAESRKEIMFNDFVIVGPEADPAKVKGMAVEKALATIRTKGKTFVSRGDNSGTNKKEKLLWKAAGGPLPEKEAWYVQTGQGMLASLNITAERGGYTMTDRGTYIKYSHKNGGNPPLKVLVEGGAILKNQYSVLILNSSNCPDAQKELAEAFSAWMAGDRAQKLIADFRLLGMALFTPNAQ